MMAGKHYCTFRFVVCFVLWVSVRVLTGPRYWGLLIGIHREGLHHWELPIGIRPGGLR